MEDQVTLEAYADQNRALIHNQRNNEALAICKHILRYFPKHLETYRQMGEAYLNLEDLESAKDMFRRVLSADPEDLVAYIGLSTIFEQQRLYEETIWHLERAYELAPENIEIQKELMRLYPEVGIRVQQRVRMTSSTLARLYIREGLYPQAIQELKLILAQSPTRFDANVALAGTLWNAGRLREAADVAEKLLATLPYCLKANLILGTVWKESGVPEGDLHLQRAQEVDPTNQVAHKVLGARSTLPVLQVTVPRYVEGAMPPEQPAPSQPAQPTTADQASWLGEPTTEKSEIVSRTPNLFDSQPAPAETAQATTAEPTSEEDMVTGLPDWLTQELPPVAETQETPSVQPPGQGLATDSSSLEQAVTGTPPAQETTEPFGLSEEETPEWLKGWQIVPEEPAPTTPSAETTPTATAETAPTPTDESPDWLQGLETTAETKPTETVEPAEEAAEEIPEWLRGLQLADQEPVAPIAEEKPAPSEETVPAVPFASESAPTAEAQPPAPVAEEQPMSAEEALPALPAEWASTPTAEAEPGSSDEQSFADFLSNLGQEAAPPAPAASEPQPSTEEEYRLPSFLGEVQPVTPAVEEPTTPSAELPVPDFLASAPSEAETFTPSEAYPIPSFLDTQEPVAPSAPPAPDWLTSPTEEMVAPEMPPTPQPLDTVPSIVVETPPAPAPRVRKPRRVPKGAERLTQARQYRDAQEIDKALAEYDYIVQRAPRLIKEVIDDLEVLVQPIDAPLEAHRILGDAYAHADRLNDALERYRFVMEHSPKAS